MHPTYYVQECPVCGRPLEIRVEYLGHEVSCEHCGGRFRAVDPESHAAADVEADLLYRADVLLEATDRRLGFHNGEI